MLFAVSAVAATVPMLLYLILIWSYDRYDREPFGLVLKCYLWGAFGAIIAAITWSSIFSALASLILTAKESLRSFETIAIAPFVEEVTKGVFLFYIIKNRRFDSTTDGFVYGGAIGLGFGMTENFLYFISFGTTVAHWITLVVIRTLFSAVMHCVATASFGAFLAYGKFKGGSYKPAFIITGLFTAIFIHFAWNFSVSFDSTALTGFAFMFFSVLIFAAVFSVSVSGEKKVIYNELLPEAESGLIPAEHLHILNSHKRNSLGWVDENVRKLYIRAATTLAFRKLQLKNSSGLSRLYYEEDISYYRNFIRNLLANK
jgi:RsiW-degrading membrane proteinase PrsW (M82 family)